VVDPHVIPTAEVVSANDTGLVVRLRWRPRDVGEDRELFQVLRLLDDRIREIADYRTARAATRTLS
jgi:hypothetical protein